MQNKKSRIDKAPASCDGTGIIPSVKVKISKYFVLVNTILFVHSRIKLLNIDNIINKEL